MVKVKVQGENLSKFLKDWDKEVYDLNIEIKNLHLKNKNNLSYKRKKGLRLEYISNN